VEIERKLAEMGLELPPTPTPGGNYVETVRSGNYLFVAGHVPRKADGGMLHPGKLGRDVTVEQGYEAAQLVALNCLSSIKHAIGDLDKVKQVLKVLCMVNSADGFGDQPRVANGASDLLVNLFGDRGRHTRSAVGMGGLPANCCVEAEMMVELEE
jgi:enamine deaminase RidA (YjgF/YER057c/UK114 family)